jgi:hypothetical protein
MTIFCPRCGKQHSGTDVRFCSSCGFQLRVVTDLMANNGLLPHQLPNEVPPPSGISQRKKAMKNGAKLMFLSAIITPIFFAFAVGAVDSPAPLVVPFTIFLAGLCWLVYGAIFGDETPLMPRQTFPQQFVPPPPPRSALPGVENFRMTGMAPQRVQTSEIVEPPNVTDHTTQLFDKE